MNQNAGTAVILGLARQGKALARFYAECGRRVIVSDSRSAEALQPAMADLVDLGLEYVLGGHPLRLLEGCAVLCPSGGVPLDLPIVREAVSRGIRLSNDAQEFLARCPAWWSILVLLVTVTTVITRLRQVAILWTLSRSPQAFHCSFWAVWLFFAGEETRC